VNHGPTLHPGSTGSDVRRLQRLLVETKLLDATGIDGSFGPHTEAAVKSFQQGEGLTADGIVGALTWAALPADPNTPQLAEGATGSVVSALQHALRTFHGPGGDTDPGAIDGVFGPHTKKGVRAYQHDRGLPVDGIVGDQTWWTPAGGAGATLASLAGVTTV
jgi:peptidoglycan hydrolase-like protein with peptidoglycan-binding domain